MAVLVTGGAGYIGSHMVWALLDAGEDVVVLDRLSTGFRWAVAPAARFYLGDVADPDILKKIFIENDIEAIIHFAGSAVVPVSVADPLSYYDNNSGKTEHFRRSRFGDHLVSVDRRHRANFTVSRRRFWCCWHRW